MKKNWITWGGLLLLGLFASCEKDLQSFPIVATTGITEQVNLGWYDGENHLEASVSLGGNITSSGGAEVTMRGFVWGTSAAPTMEDNIVSRGSGIGEFTGVIHGMPAGTYNVRAFAVNSVGIGYGQVISFTIIQY